jgi:hypothetical protein
MSPDLSDLLTALVEEPPNDELVIRPENFCFIHHKMFLESLSPELKLEYCGFLESAIKKDEMVLYKEGSDILPQTIKKEIKSENQSSKLYLKLLRDPHCLDKFDDEMKEKKVIGNNLGVIENNRQSNKMIIQGLILIIADGDFYKIKYIDKYGRTVSITRSNIISALLKKYKVKDNKMLRTKPAKCKYHAQSFLQTVRDYENSRLNYFKK